MTAGAAFGTVCDDLAARLSTNMSGLRVETDGSALIAPPAAVIDGFDEADQDEFQGYRWLIPVTFYVSRASDRAGHAKLKTYASPGSGGVWNAVGVKPVAGDSIDSAAVVRLRDYGVYEAGDVSYLGFQALVEVFA